MIAMTMLPDILARVVGGSSWLGWFQMRLNWELCFLLSRKRRSMVVVIVLSRSS